MSEAERDTKILANYINMQMFNKTTYEFKSIENRLTKYIENFLFR